MRTHKNKLDERNFEKIPPSDKEKNLSALKILQDRLNLKTEREKLREKLREDREYLYNLSLKIQRLDNVLDEMVKEK